METIEKILKDLASIRYYAKDIAKIRELLSMNLPESNLLQKASKINYEVGYYIVCQLYQDGDPNVFSKKVAQCKIPDQLLRVIKFLDMPEKRRAEQSFNSLRKKLIKKGMNEEEWILETSKTHMYHTQQWIMKKYREKDSYRFSHLCHLIGWDVDELFPLLHKICNASRKI